MLMFGDVHRLTGSLTSSQWTREPAIALFQCKSCVHSEIHPTTRLAHYQWQQSVAQALASKFVAGFTAYTATESTELL